MSLWTLKGDTWGMNQMTPKGGLAREGLVPELGDSWTKEVSFLVMSQHTPVVLMVRMVS